MRVSYYLLYGGSLLTVFSLFMLSLAKPDQYYQVSLITAQLNASNCNHFSKVFLSQGIGAGLGAGITYVPSVAVVSHYFSKRRALAMTIVASGSSVGSVIHPIMLNHTLGTRLGFGNAVRASAGLVGGLLLVACLLMRTRIPTHKKSTGGRKLLKKLSRDSAYISATLGFILSFALLASIDRPTVYYRLMTFTAGFYYPQFYLQLDATSHHLDKTFSFYSVESSLNSCQMSTNTFGWLARYHELCKLHWQSSSRLLYQLLRDREHDFCRCCMLFSTYIWDDWDWKCGERCSPWCLIRVLCGFL